MTWPEGQREAIYGPRTGRFIPAAPVQAIAAAPPAWSSPGLTRTNGMAAAPSSSLLKKERLPSAAAPPFMPRAAAKKLGARKTVPASPAASSSMVPPVEKCMNCTVGDEKNCLRTTYTCAQTAAGIFNGQKKPEMDPMFFGVAVDGSNEEDEEGDQFSIGSSNGGRSSARSTGFSPSEKSRSSEEVTSTDKKFNELLVNIQNQWVIRHKVLQDKYDEMDRVVEQVQQMARECGANEDTPYWLGVLEIIHSKRATKFFMGSDPVGRMKIIKHFSRLHECQDIESNTFVKRDAEPALYSRDKWEEEFYNLVQDYNNSVGSSHGTSYREELSGRRRSKPSRFSLQEKQVSSKRTSKRRKTT